MRKEDLNWWLSPVGEVFNRYVEAPGCRIDASQYTLVTRTINVLQNCDVLTFADIDDLLSRKDVPGMGKKIRGLIAEIFAAYSDRYLLVS